MTTAPIHPTSETSIGFGSRVHSWVISVDHKKLGMMYIGVGLLFFVIGGLEATLMWLQLLKPLNDVLTPHGFNQMFTMHGTTMVFLVGMPVLLGFGNYLIPLMIGARDMAFPRLNAFGLWLFIFGGLLLYYSFIGGDGLYGMGGAPDVGWFAYSPLTSKAFSVGHATDYWILGIMVSGFGSMTTAINFMATIVCMRCPGMTFMRMPLFVWLMFTVGILVLLALPVLTGAQVMLLFDRFLGAHFFDPQQQGSVIFWQHLFWFFGHPEVYILILPAFGMICEIIPVFSRKVIFGYPLMVAATLSIAFISLGVWVHHMFSVGLPPWLNSIFAASTFLIAVPTGMKMFNWIGTMWGGNIRFTVSMMFATGFLVMFLFGGLTGIMLAVVPFDWQLSDSYFVVGHFHYVLFGGTMLAVFSAVFYWFPKATGRLLSEPMGKWTFWMFMIGLTLTFFPMHLSGVLGMPRRVYTYQPGRGFELWNLISSSGVPFQIVGVLLLVTNIIKSLINGRVAGPDPWDAWTLEWATSSPPPSENFPKIPTCTSPRPLWDRKHPEDPDCFYE